MLSLISVMSLPLSCAIYRCTHIHTMLSPLDLWTDPAGVAALLARWMVKLDGGPQAGRSDSFCPLARAKGVGIQPQPTSCLGRPIGAHSGEVMYFWSVCFWGELGFLNCNDIRMCVVNKQFELLKFVFDSVYVCEFV